MTNQITPIASAEEVEYQTNQQILSDLEENLAAQELELASFATEIRRFELTYLRTVGKRYAELDEIRARVKKLITELYPANKHAQAEYEEAQHRAHESAQTFNNAPPPDTQPFEPTDDIRTKYRDVAKKVHPDLATNEEDRQYRTELMARANAAYEQGDIATLESILNEYELSPEAVSGSNWQSRIEKVIRKIRQVKQRLSAIAREMQDLKNSDIGQLFEHARKNNVTPEVMLQRIVAQIDDEIAVELEKWAQLIRHRPKV